MANNRTPVERAGDLHAQIAANQRGVQRTAELISRYGPEEITEYWQHLLDYSARMTRSLIASLPEGSYHLHRPAG